MSALWLLPLWAPLLGGAADPAPPPPAPPTSAPLTLGDCFEVARTRNERIGRAVEEIEQARLDRQIARAGILPEVWLEDTYYRQERVDLAEPGGGAFTFADRRNQALVHLSQPIFRGLREFNAISAAGHALAAERHALADAARSLYADVALAFFSVLQFEARMATLEGTVALEKERLREIRARTEVGLARRTEALLIESQLAADESSLEAARNNLELGREQLAFLMASPPGGDLRDDVIVPDAPEPPDPEQAFGRRSDHARLQARVEEAAEVVAVARGAYLPTVDLDADFILARDNYSEFAAETDWTAELTFRLPLFEGGRIRAGVGKARSELKQAMLDRDELKRRIALQVKSAWLLLESDLAQRRTLESSLASSDENYRLASEEYRSGISSNLEVIAAQNLLLSNRLSLERQRHQVKLDWILLQLAQGELPGVEE